jgi:histidine triad (HIT) family protein
MSDCLFCKMVAGDIKPDVLYSDEHVLAIRDINPQAPFHALVIPREHIATLNDLEPRHADTVGRMYLAARDLAAAQGFAADGFRTVMNCNRLAGQTVFHIHLHVLAGRAMHWPPG